MTSIRPIPLAELERMLDEGYALEGVSSTDDHLLLCLSGRGGQRVVALDRARTQELLSGTLLDRLVASADTGTELAPLSA